MNDSNGVPSNIDKDGLKYVDLVFSGMSREEAYAMVYPDKYQEMVDNAKKKRIHLGRHVKSKINQFESTPKIKGLFAHGSDKYWTSFIGLRTKILNKLGRDALDESNDIKDQLNASKLFLGAVPMMDKTLKVDVKVRLSDDEDFIRQLQDKKKLLMDMIPDAELIDED